MIMNVLDITAYCVPNLDSLRACMMMMMYERASFALVGGRAGGRGCQ